LIPRIPFDDLDDRLAVRLAPRVERLGYLGEFFQCGANQPDALAHFIDFTESSKAGLDAVMVEVVALTASARLHNLYERHQHERLSVRSGRTAAWVAAVLRGAGVDQLPASLPAVVLDPDHVAIQRLVLATIADPSTATIEGRAEISGALEAVIRVIGPEKAVGILFITARYLAHAAVVRALAIDPPVPSIFFDGNAFLDDHQLTNANGTTP